MSIHTSESKTQQSIITETYTFHYHTSIYRYTSAPEDYVVAGYTFTSESIERGGYGFGSRNESSQIQVTIPASNAMASLLKPTYDLRPMRLYVNRYFSDEPDEAESLFIGDLTAVTFSDGVCNLTFENRMNAIKKSVCRVRMQALCNNQLYDTVCALSRQSFQTTCTVTLSSDGKTLTSVAFSAYEDGYFTLGSVYYDGHWRTVTKHEGSNVYINRSISGLTDGATIDAYAGCNKKPETCTDKFNNFDNFVGMPYIPLKDIGGVPITSV